VHAALATASLRLAEGDERGAAGTLRKAAELYGIDRGSDRRWWRQNLALSYLLVPDARAVWDERDLRGHLSIVRTLAAATVARREGGDATALRALDLPNIGVVRAALHHRFAAELAVGLSEAGRSEGRQLLDVLGPPGRAAVRALAADPQPQDRRLARAAKSLLVSVPAPPQHPTYLGVLGPLTLRRGGRQGTEVNDPDVRRLRLVELVAFLVGHRRTTRAAIAAALWPDLDGRAAANNLGVTLNHLLRLLEPWRAKGEPAYLVRLEGHTVELHTGLHLEVDVDTFDRHVAAAARAETDGLPSLALEHHLAAVELYRDDLHVDLPEADWFALEREHYRSRFVASAVRAGELLLGRGEVDRAEAVANRALAADRWSEAGYAVLVGAALARGDRSAAHRILGRSVAMLGDLGASPSPATEQLRRRVLDAA
jgi:DNA-binding SARP family transcriptional activator